MIWTDNLEFTKKILTKYDYGLLLEEQVDKIFIQWSYLEYLVQAQNLLEKNHTTEQ
jgi:hypothetical protein